MKNKPVYLTVVALHVLAIGALVCVQGCGTTGVGPVVTSEPPAPVMPPPYEVESIETKRSISKYVSTTTMVSPPAPVAQQATQKSWGGATTEYVVRKGDSLSLIASRYGVTTAELVSLNQIKNKNIIRVGQRLLLPGNVSVANPRPVKRSASAPPAKPGHEKYVVRKGDSLSVIAYRYGVSIKALQQVNGISGHVIRVGQTLYLPKGAKLRAASDGASSSTGSTPPEPRVERTSPIPVSVDTPRSVSVDVPDADVTPPGPVVVPTSVSGEDFITHVVEADEDVYSIAMRYTVLPDDVKRLNGLTSNKLQPGQQLKIRVPRSGN